MMVSDLFKIVDDFQSIKVLRNRDCKEVELYYGMFRGIPADLLEKYILKIEITVCKCCGTHYIKIYV